MAASTCSPTARGLKPLLHCSVTHSRIAAATGSACADVSIANSAGRFRLEFMILVSTKLGHKTDTFGLNPPRCSSRYTFSERPTTANLLVPYSVPAAMSPANEAVFTMWASVSCSIMIGRNERIPCTTPMRLTPSIQCQSSRELVQLVPLPSPLSPPMPALLQSTCTAPYLLSVCFAKLFT